MMEATLNKFWYKLLFVFVKYIPIILAIIVFLYLIFLFFGIDCILLTYLGSLSLFPFICLIAMSKLLRFCFIHRLPLYYSMLTSTLNTIDYFYPIPYVYGLLLILTFIFIVIYSYFKLK